MKYRLGILFALFALSRIAVAEIAVETPTTKTLSAPSAHWMWIGDLNFNAMEAGKAFLIDGDSGQMLGMLSTGYFFSSALQDSHYKNIYAPEVYLSRGTRGERTDIIAIYDPKTLEPTAEIIIPAKHYSGVPVIGHAAISTDDRFIAVYNFTPAQSVSIVDVKNKKFLHEVETPGCAEVFAGGARAFNMICGDGTMLTLKLDDAGMAEPVRSEKFFDPKADIVDDKMAPYGDKWAFFTKSGKVQMIDMAAGEPTFDTPWPLFTADQVADNWKLGGYQYATICEQTNELYVLVHRGGAYSHKDPGSDVWVYDLKAKTRTRMISLEHKATSIQVTGDSKPLLFTADAEHTGVHVYDALSGTHEREIAEVATTPVLFWAVRP
ncbi:MAG: methylamine dehydrogenase heavy chain [Gammaproteobacteria bacterium]|jgi:methylamine dehydrogenase heavy chain